MVDAQIELVAVEIEVPDSIQKIVYFFEVGSNMLRIYLNTVKQSKSPKTFLMGKEGNETKA